MKNFISFLKDESGQTSTEYILLVAMVAMIVIRFGGEAQDRLSELTNKVFEGASSNIRF